MSKADGLSVKQWQDDVIKGVCVLWACWNISLCWHICTLALLCVYVCLCYSFT